MQIFSKWHVSLTQAVLGVLTLGVWVLIAQHAFSPMVGAADAAPAEAKTATFDTITVHRINVVDGQGQNRLVLADPSHFPDPKVRGDTLKRSIHNVAGIVFYNADGDEVGGLAMSKAQGGSKTALILDYNVQPTDGIGISRTETADGKHWSTGFAINDRRPYRAGKIKSSQGVQRISLANSDKNAELVISDPEGNPRIRIGVDDAGKPRMQMLDASGKVVYRAPLVTSAKSSGSTSGKH